MCWGSNDAAQLGTGNLQNSSVPVEVAGGGTYARVSAGGVGSCAVNAAGEAFCWGHGGNPQTQQRGPDPVPGAARFATLDPGDTYSQACGLRTDGGMSCWSFFEAGTFDRLGAFRAVVGGHPCGVAASGSGVQCWPQRTGGPYAVEGATGALVGIEGGPRSVCTWNTQGQAFCTTQYTAGAGGTSSVHSFAPIAGQVAFSQVSAGGSLACGLAAGGTAYCWTITAAGGALVEVSYGTPVPVGGSPRFTRISAGSAHACGVTTDDAVYCWGSNEHGQLGLGTTGGTQAEPVRVADP